MSRGSQLAIFTVVVAILVFAVTFTLQWRGRRTGGGPSSLVESKESLLTFPSPVYPPPPEAGKPATLHKEYEWGEEGSHDFWFINTSDDRKGTTEVELGVFKKGCTCTNMQIAIAPDNWKDLSEAELKKARESVTWSEIDDDDPATTDKNNFVRVPAQGAGWVRLHWKPADPSTTQIGDRTLSPILWTRTDKVYGQVSVLRLFAPYVNPVHVSNEESPKLNSLNSDKTPKLGFFDSKVVFPGTFQPDDKPLVKVLFWSSTRQFSWDKELRVPEDKDILEFEKTEMTAEELEELGKSYNRKPICGYRVQFRLKSPNVGLFTRQIDFSNNPARPLLVSVRGVSAGKIRVLQKDPNKPSHTFSLGDFSVKVGCKETLFLKLDSDHTVALDPKKKMPAFLKVNGPSKSPDRDTWELSVGIDAHAEGVSAGPIGGEDDERTAVDLTVMKGSEVVERMRIPVVGKAVP